jgi:uncharacterized protein with HEPN domain
LPFDDPFSAFRDIAEAIDTIQQFTEGMDFEAFRTDVKTVAAVVGAVQSTIVSG